MNRFIICRNFKIKKALVKILDIFDRFLVTTACKVGHWPSYGKNSTIYNTEGHNVQQMIDLYIVVFPS